MALSRARKGLLVAACPCALILVVFVGSGVRPARAADICPNAPFRIGPSAFLPNCRAYEQVSPANKNGSDIDNSGGSESAPTGDRVAYAVANSFGDAQGSGLVNYYRSIRGDAGWSTRAISPPMSSVPPSSSLLNSTLLSALSPDLSAGVFRASPDQPALPGTQPGAFNVYRQLSVPEGPYELLNPPYPNPDQSSGSDPLVVDASTDLSHVLVESTQPLTPGAPAQRDVYDLTAAGQVHLVGVLPEGTVAPEGAHTSSGPGGAGIQNGPMSADGSRVFFIAGTGAETSLYARVNNTTTTKIAILGEIGNFQGATPDGLRAFFTNENRELFEYDLDSGQTTDLAPLANGNVVGFGDDGHYVYLLFDGADLEVWHDGTVTPIAAGIGGIQTLDTWDVSPSGRYMVFQSTQPLTAYDNAGHQEVYRYDAQAGVLDCVSCDPDGAPASGDAALHSFHVFFTVITAQIYHQRNVLDNGRVFFESTDALVPSDTNGDGGCPIVNPTFHDRSCQDVYQWEDGQPRLISGGQSNSPSSFVDASPSGDDVFFLTRQQLVGSDIDNNVDVYDAKVGGGFPPPPPPPPPCSGDACLGNATAPPTEPSFGSSSFSGPGNQGRNRGGTTSRCGKHRKLKHGKCVRKRRHLKRSPSQRKRAPRL
ncbi:MAG TPA: hypothetical protein VHU14_03620 [Solirubrobacterales bacterium]|jgi:hypothetical protein|nr:hypothetical protein [Solirubrobacterales bacterium]